MKDLTTGNTVRVRLIANAPPAGPNAALNEGGKTYATRLDRLKAGGKKKAAKVAAEGRTGGARKRKVS